MKKTKIKNTPVFIIDNAIPSNILTNIKSYLSTITFSNSYKEFEQSKYVHFHCPQSQGNLQQKFSLQNWFTNYITEYESRATLRHQVSATIPCFAKGSTVQQHKDFTAVNEDTFYISTTLFLNEQDKDKNSGLFIEDEYIQNQFNRLIIYGGHLNHKVRVPDNDCLRLTLDIHLSNATIETNQTYENNLVTFIK